MAKATRPQWYVQLNGIEEGPMTSQTLRSLAEAGRIYPDTPIRKEGMTKTVQASKIKGLLKLSTQQNIIGGQVKSDYRPSIRRSDENTYESSEKITKKNTTVDINDSPDENPILRIAKKIVLGVLMIFAIIAIFSPLRTIILQATIVITGLWALITGKIWIIDDKYTIKSSTGRGIGALLVSAAPLSFIACIVVINRYGYTQNAKTYGTLIEVCIFGVITIVSYVIYRIVRQVK